MPPRDPDSGRFDEDGPKKSLFQGRVEISADRSVNWIGDDFPIDVVVRIDGQFCLPVRRAPRRASRLARLFNAPPDPDEFVLRLRLRHVHVRVDSPSLAVREPRYSEKVPASEFNSKTEAATHQTAKSGWTLGGALGFTASLPSAHGKAEAKIGGEKSTQRQYNEKITTKIVAQPYRIKDIADGWRIEEPAGFLDGKYRNEGSPWCHLAFHPGKTEGKVGFTVTVRDDGVAVERPDGMEPNEAEMRDAIAAIALLTQAQDFPPSRIAAETPIARVTYQVNQGIDPPPEAETHQPLPPDEGLKMPKRPRRRPR